MPETNYISQITIPVEIEGTVTNVTYNVKDAEARQLIEDLGDAVYWMGVTTTELVDNTTTTNPITINGNAVTAVIGGMAQYDGEEFVWNGSVWQAVGKNNFGSLAFQSSASTNYTPEGTVTITSTKEADATASVTPFGTAGTLPSMTVSGETLTFNPGTIATAGTPVNVVTAVGAITTTAAFIGAGTTITVQ